MPLGGQAAFPGHRSATDFVARYEWAGSAIISRTRSAIRASRSQTAVSSYKGGALTSTPWVCCDGWRASTSATGMTSIPMNSPFSIVYGAWQPQTRSALMDRETLLAHRDRWPLGSDPADARRTGPLRRLGRRCARGTIRLEQEGIGPTGPVVGVLPNAHVFTVFGGQFSKKPPNPRSTSSASSPTCSAPTDSGTSALSRSSL